MKRGGFYLETNLSSFSHNKGVSKITPSLFTIKEGVFRKPTSPPLPLREGPPLISVFSPQGRRGNRSSSSLVTISFYGWRTIRGLRQQRSCGFLCGDEPALTQGLGYGLLAPCCSYWLLAGCLLAVCLILAGCSFQFA